MDVVTHACAVTCRVVAPKHAELCALAKSDLLNVGHQVVWNAYRVLSDLACIQLEVSITQSILCKSAHQSLQDCADASTILALKASPTRTALLTQ